MNGRTAAVFVMLNSARIVELSKGRLCGAVRPEISVVAECSSTNDLAFEALTRAGAATHGSVFIAEHQSAGRGRRGNTWHSRPGRGLLMSLALHSPEAPPAPALVAASALAVHDATRGICGLTPRIKWPNDLYIHEKKFCGILVEARTSAAGALLVVGIGVNLNQDPAVDLDPAVAGTATSLLAAAGAAVDRELFTSQLLVQLAGRLECALARDYSQIERDFLAGLQFQGQHVCISLTSGAVHRGALADFSILRGIALQSGPQEIRFPSETVAKLYLDDSRL